MHACKKFIFAAACVGIFFSSPAFAADIVGVWKRDDGTAQIRMAQCGDGICGTITQVEKKTAEQTPSARVGMKVFDLKKDSDGLYTGTAFNPQDGNTYSGKATVSGNQLITQGCVLGGLICKTLTWVRIK